MPLAHAHFAGNSFKLLQTRPTLARTRSVANELQERKPVSHVMIMCSSCYNAVPPPPCDGDKSGDSGKGDVVPQALKDDTTQPQEGSGSRNEKPANVSTDQWKVMTTTQHYNTS